jgi:hypothetical protein
MMTNSPDEVILQSEVRQKEAKAVQLVWAGIIPFPLPAHKAQEFLTRWEFETVLHGVRKAARRHTRGDFKALEPTYIINYAEMQMVNWPLRRSRGGVL